MKSGPIRSFYTTGSKHFPDIRRIYNIDQEAYISFNIKGGDHSVKVDSIERNIADIHSKTRNGHP